jgi:phenylalanyl-tRNA synthetase alpha chain
MYKVPKLEDWSEKSLDKAVQEFRSALEVESSELEKKSVDSQIASKDRLTAVQQFHSRWISRKNGLFSQLTSVWLPSAPKEAKREVGRRVNELRAQDLPQIEHLIEKAQLFARQSREAVASTKIFDDHVGALLESESIDVTLPGVRHPIGVEHPLIKTMNEIVGVFKAMGYSVAEGPEVETDYYNFESLNFPPNHPARDTQDTLIIAGQENKPLRERLLMRTHTSPVQIRAMEKQAPPVRVVCPGKVHRADTADATHSPIFHQVEGLAVDTNITFSDLKGTLDHAMKALFGSDVKTRFYPSFFPFTEPSADVQITCFRCGGKGVYQGNPCRLCKQSGWIELLGCGMVDPAVYGFVDYDPKKFSGFAFGMGVERIAMLKYEIDDIQLFYQGDMRFLEQFA